MNKDQNENKMAQTTWMECLIQSRRNTNQTSEIKSKIQSRQEPRDTNSVWLLYKCGVYDNL